MRKILYQFFKNIFNEDIQFLFFFNFLNITPYKSKERERQVIGLKFN